VLDVVLALALLALGWANIAFGLGSFDPGESRLLDTVVLPISVLPVAWRRIAPWPVFLLVAGSVLVPDLFLRTGFTTLGEFLALDLALYTVAAQAAVRHAVLALLVSQLEFVVLAARRPDFDGLGAYLFWTVVTVGPWAAGLAAAALRRRNTALHDLAAHEAELARQAIVDERVRISRELHDVISHHVTLMVVQASVADRLLPDDPARAREALAHVARAGRSAVEELELLLQVLRTQPDESTASPPPSLARLGQLQNDLRAAGLRVDCTVEGDQRELAPAVDASAYRILQEALTNVLRHSGKEAAQLRLRYGARQLELEVRDDGRGLAVPARAGGAGLVGMRERALLHGGSFEAGHAAGGGFRVHVALPLSSGES
jgi:signal transduction histidine kinase